MATYIELRNKVRDWSNRDSEVLNDNIIRDCIRYAADKAYRALRIPPLELIVEYNLTADQAAARTIPVPADLTEFISLTKTAGNGIINNNSSDPFELVYNQKVDIRTFKDAQASHPQYPYWTREQGNILLSTFPAPSEGDIFELYYYGRGLAVNIDSVFTHIDSDGVEQQIYLQAQGTDPETYVYATDTRTLWPSESDSILVGEISPIFNWLRDENERVLLFGALMECFSYLGEDDMQAKYLQMFQEEINELNREEEMRTASGGNTVIQYTSYLI